MIIIFFNIVTCLFAPSFFMKIEKSSAQRKKMVHGPVAFWMYFVKSVYTNKNNDLCREKDIRLWETDKTLSIPFKVLVKLFSNEDFLLFSLVLTL